MTKIPLTHANIIQLLGIESLPLDERKEIVMSAVELVETRAFNQVMSQLGDEPKKQLADFLEKEDIDSISNLLEKNNIDLMAITEKEVEKVKHELLEISKE